MIRFIDYFKFPKKEKGEKILAVCSSFEPRCMHAVKLIRNSKAVFDKGYLFSYPGEPHIKEKEINKQKTHMILSEICAEVIPREVEKYSDADIMNWIDEISQSNSPISLTLDVSTFTNYSIFGMLFHLRQTNFLSNLRLLYTPGIYAYEPKLTWGLREVITLPWLSNGHSAPGGKRTLVLLLGYDQSRAAGVIDYIEPENIIAYIGERDGQKFGDIEVSEGAPKCLRLNRKLIQYARIAKFEYGSALDPETVCEILTPICTNELDLGREVYIAPIGTKMEAVGTYLLCNELNKKYEGFCILYPRPVKHYERYTIGVFDRIVEYNFPL
ncbi:MAG: hypothetical protein RX316_06495 [bacterium]|nr:hypothetical protein [bacterium]